ncbi:MAG TPA: Zn-dependent hydrolase [Hyphomicrobiaceae bacterium]|nr:Zn-dependent hydrolase [Hyphomicrobiaceae bacterium]
MASNLQINADRLWSTIMASAEIGKGPRGGLCRLTLSDDDRTVRDLVAGWANVAGWSLTVDRLGSMFIARRGREPSLPPVLIGSHLDTQAAGGRFDGILGVMAGIEVLRTLDDLGLETRRTIEVVNWTNEEGARFQPPMLCSLAFAGKAAADWVLDRIDKEGRRFGDELARIGYAGSAAVGGRAIDAYFELHIEQGPKLDAAKVPLGVVVGGFPTAGMRIEIRGRTSHVGPTPMEHRRNALVAAAHVAVAVDEIGWRYAAGEGKTTAARLDLWPNLPGILSERATLYCDLRHPDASALERMLAEVATAIPDCARRGRCEIEIAERWGFGGFSFDRDLIALIRASAARRGVATLDLKSEAGHDAYHMASISPAAMIFTPCKGGISHNEEEDMTLAEAVPGASVLLDAVLERANR